jgi:hypothetical protein
MAIRNEEDWDIFKMGFGSGKIHIGAPKRFPFIALAHSPGDPNCIHYVFVYRDEFDQQTVFPPEE